MKDSLRTGIFFGMTSAVITTLGLIIGLHAGTHSRMAVLAGVLTIAIADAFSDALGIHIAEESDHKNSAEHVWIATISTFFAKFLFALTFIIPLIICSLSAAIFFSLSWGFLILTVLSYFIARTQYEPPWKIISEHLIITILVLGITHFIGNLIRTICV